MGQPSYGAEAPNSLLGANLGRSGVNDAVLAEGDGGAGALPGRALDAQAGTVGRSQRPRQRQAEPEARAIASKPSSGTWRGTGGGARAGPRRQGSMRGHAGTGIGDADVQSRADAGNGNGHAVA